MSRYRKGPSIRLLSARISNDVFNPRIGLLFLLFGLIFAPDLQSESPEGFIEGICLSYIRITPEVMPLDAVEIDRGDPTDPAHLFPHSIYLEVPDVLDDRVLDSAIIEIGKKPKYRFTLQSSIGNPAHSYFRFRMPERDLKHSTIKFRYDGAGDCRGATGIFYDYAYPLSNVPPAHR